MKYFLITYGCQMNVSDSGKIAATLEKQGYQPAPKEEEADLIIVNMCSVRQTAVDRVHGKIKDFFELKNKNPELKTVLTGCVLKSDRNNFREKFDEIWNNKDFLENPPKHLSPNQAYVPISNGCDNACTYCAVPQTRGPLICRDHKSVIKDAERAVKNGFKEIWLLGQNVNNYRSPVDKSINFSKLLKIINSVPGDFKIKFTSPHPKDFSDELIKTMASCQKAAHYLNLPLQSGDNEILKKMGRPYTVSHYRKLVKKIRKKIPDLNLSTDIIIGFPGETKKQFKNTVKIFKEINFDMAYISKFSPRSGTVAAKLKDNVSLKEKKRRWEILNKIILRNFKKRKRQRSLVASTR